MPVSVTSNPRIAMPILTHPRPLGVTTYKQGVCRLSRATHERLVELKARTGLPFDAIIFALLTEAMAVPADLAA